MARQAEKPCSVPDCPNTVPLGTQYCSEHEHLKPAKVRSKIYGKAQWGKVRNRQLKREPLCRECKAHGLLVPANTVDHIKPIEEGGAMWDPENLQSMCHSCHSRKTAKEGSFKPKVYTY